MDRRWSIPLILSGLVVLLLAALPRLAQASPAMISLPLLDGPIRVNLGQAQVMETVANRVCLECHGKPGLTLTLQNGETLDLFVSPEMYTASIHGEKGYGCVQCHQTVGSYPHPAFTAADKRDASIQLYQACQRCHSSQYDRSLDSVHAVALAAGNRNAAICTDCHTAHDVKRLTDPTTRKISAEARAWIPGTCAHCHNEIYQKYLTSVHGSALVGEGNPDVPTCIDCHGVHNIQNPTTNTFRLNSPQLCTDCHTDPQIMDKYGISTQVLNSYVADFHGTTVTLFEKQDPAAATNKPVCFDCHGVHEIKRPDDPEKGLQVRANLLTRCQACHPDATTNFPDAWLSHYIPSQEKFPLVYNVNLFYQFLIPGILGSMAILVALDLSWRVRSRLWKPKRPPKQQPEAKPTPVLSEPAADLAGGSQFSAEPKGTQPETTLSGLKMSVSEAETGTPETENAALKPGQPAPDVESLATELQISAPEVDIAPPDQETKAAGLDSPDQELPHV